MDQREIPIAEFERQIEYMPVPQRLAVLQDMRSHLGLQKAVVLNELAELKERGLAPGHSKLKALGVALSTINADLGVIGRQLKKVNEHLNTCRWQDAVVALYGPDGYAACREWVIAKHAEQEKNTIPSDLVPYMAQYGLTGNFPNGK